MPEYNQAEVELTFARNGITKVQETDGIAIYQKNTYPDCEIVMVWEHSAGTIERDDLERQLDDADAPTEAILKDLDDNRNKPE